MPHNYVTVEGFAGIEAFTFKGILGQAAPAATVLTDIYTVPVARNSTCFVIATNRVGVAATFRVALAVAGAADSNEQYVAFDKEIEASDTGATITFSIGPTDVIRVYSSNGNLSFTVTGVEQKS